MHVTNKSDFPVDDASCRAATGKTLGEWFAELDSIDALKKGRRDSIRYMYEQKADAWWPTTIFVEYEKMHDVRKKDGFFEGFTVCCTKTIAASPEKVYALWTDPSRFAEWYGDNGKEEVRDGGSFSCDAGTKGTFTRVRANKDLRFTWEHPGLTGPVTIDVMFQDNKGKCLMNVMPSRMQSRGEADGLREAWGAALNRLKALAEA
jgi:uncharacterized protein YndB with AHSA1/START domain